MLALQPLIDILGTIDFFGAFLDGTVFDDDAKALAIAAL